MNFATRRYSILASIPQTETSPELSRGFPARARADARVLILGSLPGQRSIAAGQYYAHPRNAFWRIVGELFDMPPTLAYADRIAALNRAGVALWDVLHASQRDGSLDSAIQVSTARCNDFNTFFAQHRQIELIAFNGRKAADLFRKLVEPQLERPVPSRLLLPSTSPAYAAMSYQEKLSRWRQVCAPCP